ncbi:uncharacterized protein LOC125780090, partial [Bactrocera dorsalis]|uniref:Uncharacterized protein LOC125780090 n=1 Tax=Bactrocera dorsalis TaxID=27457 RepID=A0ABM3K7W3_BACDO
HLLFRLLPYWTTATVDTYEYDSPLVTIKQGLGKITKGTYKIIHTIDLDDYEKITNDVRLTIYQEISKTNILFPQLKHQLSEIDSLLSQLRTKNSTIQKRSINWIGSAWKWLAGNPDATDWDQILSTTHKLTENSNVQYTTNQYLIKTNNKILDSHNMIVDEISKNNKELFAQTLYNRLGIVKDEITKIIMATQLAKQGIVHSQILNKEDIANILSQTETLPFKNELQALKYAEPSMIIKDSLLLYVISLPKTEDTLYNNIIIRSTVKHLKRVYLEFTNLFISQNDKYGILGNCIEIDDTTICKRNQLKKLNKSHCISQILSGEKALCDYQYVNQAIIELISEGTIFLSNFIGNITYNNTSFKLNGTFLINFFNETITLNNVSYTNWQTSSYQILPAILQNNLTENEIKLDLNYLHKLHLNNVNELERITSKNIISISSSFLAILVAVTLSLVLYIILKPKTRNSFLIPPIIDYPQLSVANNS